MNGYVDPDNTDLVIHSLADLEDFAPFDIYVDPVLINQAVDPGNRQQNQISVEHSIFLEDAEFSKLNVFARWSNDENAMKFLEDAHASVQQVENPDFRAAILEVDQTQRRIEVDKPGSNPFLFEAWGGGFGDEDALDDIKIVYRTEITFLDGRTRSIDRKVNLELRDFKAFFTTYEVNDANRLDPDLNHFQDAGLVHESKVKRSPYLSGEESIVYVHGWNNSPASKESASRTAFKRLYRQGFRGEMIAFSWPTFYDDEGTRQSPFFDGSPIEALNFTYNPSELQAWRSGVPLRDLLLQLQSPSGSGPHLLAHSMGNVVAAEALRLHSQVAGLTTPLVSNYVAMEAAVSSGIYGYLGSDGLTINNPFLTGVNLHHFEGPSKQDLYRQWWAGNTSTVLPNTPLMEGTRTAAGKWINLYNPDDVATNFAWRFNNLGKLTLTQETPEFPHFVEALIPPFDDLEDAFNAHPGFFLPPQDIWKYRYVVERATLPDGTVENLYYRLPNNISAAGAILDVPRSQWQLLHPETHRYEILAFASVANAETLGNVELTGFTNINIAEYYIDDVESRTTADRFERSSHSFQFYHDYYSTKAFWEAVKDETSFDATW